MDVRIIVYSLARDLIRLPPMPRDLTEDTGRLFDDLDEEPVQLEGAPLADRMRPLHLSEFVGQEHLIGPGSVLSRLMEGSSALPSLILWGPPGTGKTTLARLLANRIGARFVPLSAVFSGVREVRASIAEARKDHRRGRRTLLFIDEIHRFNKGQQDALLHAVESGTVTLVGATTENPSFEVTGALLSRCRVLTLYPLTEEQVATILRRAIGDLEHGLARLQPALADEHIANLAQSCGGDARVALNALESAIEATTPGSDGVRHVSEATVIEALGRARYAYDKQG